MAALLGFRPDELMATDEWQSLSPEDRSYVVDQWAIEHKAASPAATPEEIREFNGMVDSFRQAAAPSMGERAGSFLGGVAKSIPQSLAAAATTIPAYSAEAGGSIGNAIAGASGGEFLRQAPLTTRTGLSVPSTLQNLSNWGKRQVGGEKAQAFSRLNQKLESLRSTLLDGDDDPRAVKSLAAQVAVAAAGYHGDDPTGYLYAGAPDGLADPNSFADLVKQERRPRVINSMGTRDADLRGTRTIHADPENLALAAAYRETRNPAYFEELSRRLTMSEAELRKASLTYANAVPDQADYEKAWGDLAPVKYVRGALYGQADSPVDTALALSGVGGLFRGAKAAATGALTLSQIGRGALKSTIVEGASGAASAIGSDALVSGGQIVEQAAAEVLGEAGAAAGAYGVGRGVKALAGAVYNAPEAAPIQTPLPDTPEPAPTAPPFAPEEPAVDPGTAASGLDLPTGEGEIDPSLLPGAPITAPTPMDPVGTVQETPEALAEQKRRVARGNQAGMIVPGATADSLPPELQPDENDSLVVTDTPDGAVIHALDVSREEVLAAQADGTLMETLGYATSQKPTTPDAVAVTVRTEDGTEVSAELAAPEDVPAVMEAAAAKADPTDTVSIEEPAAVVEARIEPAPAGLVPDAPSIEEAMAIAPKPKRQTKAEKAEAAANAKFLEAQAKTLKRSMQARRGAGIPDHPLGARDIFDDMLDQGQIYLPPSSERRGGDQDGAVGLAKRLPPRYMAIFNKRSGQSIDQMAQALYNDGKLADAYPETLAQAIMDAYNDRLSARKQAAAIQKEEKQVLQQGQDFQAQVVSPKPSTKADRTEVVGQDLRVGDVMTVGDHKIKVTDLDPDTGDVILEDGAKFGIQRIGENTVLYVEDHDTKGPGAALDAWDLDMDPEPLALETQTPQDVVAERQAEAQKAQQQAKAQEIERRRTAPLTGDSSNVGQGALFEEDADLFSGPSAQSRQAGIEAWADRTIAEGRKRLNSGLDPELAAAYAVKGVAILARGVRDFAAWSAEMIQEFGEVIRPHLRRIFDQATGATEADLASVAAGGQTVQSLPPGYDINRFGIRLQADERLRASWRARFSPALYKTFTEEGLAASVRQWIADNGGLPGATSLFLDDASGLQDFERNALGQQLAIAWDLRAVRMERRGDTAGTHAAEAALESVTAKLETLATQAGQALRAFGLWSKLSPRGLVRATQRRVAQAREEHVGQTLGTGSGGLEGLIRWINGNPDPATGQPTSAPPTDAEVVAAIEKAMGPQAPRKTKERVPKLVKLLRQAQNGGPLGRDAALDAWAEAFELPRLTPELAAELRAMVAEVDAAPQGSWIRQRSMSRLMSRLSMHEGMKSMDILTAFWYANILSGIGTQIVNISGNASHLLLKSVQQILTHHPREILPFIQGMLDGAEQGAVQGWAAFKDGEPVMRQAEKWERADVMEILWNDKPKTLGRIIAKYGAASWGRYVFRGLTAMDAMFYTTAKEGRAWVDVSRSLAKGQSLEQALGYDTASWTAAQRQASADLAAAGQRTPSTRDVDRRAHEILEARRAADVRASSRRFGAETTFNYEPEGTLGGIAQLINRFIVMAPPFRLVVPFTKIVANLTDKALDWTPYGLVRAGLGRHTFNHKDRRFSTQERQERIVSGALSLVGGAALYAAAKANEDQDDETVPFMIYGMGPDASRREQMPNGWRPMTIKIGNKYISYAETPLNLILGAIGGAMDQRRYGKRKDSDEAMARASALMGGMTNGILRSGMLSGLSQLIDAARGQGKWSAFAFRSASGLIPMQGVMRNLAEVIDPVKVDTATFAGAMLQNLPILRGEAQPKLNAFGEPVRTPGPWLLSRLVTFNEKPDPDAVWLGQNKLSLPGYDNDIVVGTYLSQDDKARLKATGGSLEADRQKRAENLARLENGYLTDEERTAFIKRAGALQRQAVRQLRTQTAGRQVDPKILKRQLEGKLEAARRIAMRQQMGLAPK